MPNKNEQKKYKQGFRQGYNHGHWDGFTDWMFWSHYAEPLKPYEKRTASERAFTWIMALILWPVLTVIFGLIVWAFLFTFTDAWDNLWLIFGIGGFLALLFCSRFF